MKKKQVWLQIVLYKILEHQKQAALINVKWVENEQQLLFFPLWSILSVQQEKCLCYPQIYIPSRKVAAACSSSAHLSFIAFSSQFAYSIIILTLSG